MPTRKNKTYKQLPTKHQQQKNQVNTLRALFFAIFFTLTAISAYNSTIIKHNQQHDATPTKTINDLTIINLSDINPTNDQIAWLASYQACEKHQLNATTQQLNACANDLHAIAKTENRDFSFTTPGADSYKSLGLFQISRYYHPQITDEQATDPYFSADWTLARLINNNYKTDRDNAIRKHNGSITNPKTLKYLEKVNANLINL